MVSAAVSSQCAKRRHTAADDGATAQCVDIDDERQVTSVTVWAMASTRRGLDATASLPGACRVERAAPQPLSDAQLARFAVDALIDEAELTPKPALVDGRGSGAHRDLDLPTMRRSARALESTFEALARAARQRTPSAALRAELAEIGREGEQAMMRATGGSNAHRGAIWIVGLMIAGAAISGVARGTAGTSGASASLGAASFGASASSGASGSLATASACAVASLPSAFIDSAPPVEHADSAARTRHRAYADAATVCSLGAQIACFPDRFAAPVDSHGERVRQRYQVGGARREAQDGFPHALDIGLPALAHARERGIGENAARVDALLAIMASLDDTCLLHRAGLPGLQAGQRGARRVLAAGGSSTAAGRAALSALDRALVALNASPGGAADLLAATLFLDKLSRQDFTGSTASWNT